MNEHRWRSIWVLNNYKLTKETKTTYFFLWFTNLFLAEELQVSHANHELRNERNPEQWLAQSVSQTQREVREHVAGAQLVWCCGTRDDGCNTTDHLRDHQSDRHVEASKCEQEDETDTSILDGVEQAEPEPEASRCKRRRDIAASPWEEEAEGAGSPEHLRPAGCAETDGEDGQPPWVALGDESKERKAHAPAADKESKSKTEDGAGRDVLRAEQEEPVATIWCGEEVVLEKDSEEEPERDLALDDRAKKRGDLVGHLAVVRWQTEEEDDAHCPEEECDKQSDWEKDGKRGETEVSPASRGVRADEATPEPESERVCVLQSLDPASAPDPDCDRRTTFITKVEGEEEGTTRGCCGVQTSRDVLHPGSAVEVCDEGRCTDEEESHSVEEEWEGQQIKQLDPPSRDDIDDREGQVDASDCVQLLCRLSDLSGEKCDLVRVGRDDLAECQE